MEGDSESGQDTHKSSSAGPERRTNNIKTFTALRKHDGKNYMEHLTALWIKADMIPNLLSGRKRIKYMKGKERN
jgi:hypothetical protein